MAAASVLLRTPSLARMCVTWTLAVLGEMKSSWAISALLRPEAISVSTSISLAVSARTWGSTTLVVAVRFDLDAALTHEISDGRLEGVRSQLRP